MATNNWIEIGGGGGGSVSLTIGAFDGKPEAANGLTADSTTLYAQSADSTHPGMVNTTTQTFAGGKTFSTVLTVANLIDSGLTINTVPYANGSKQLTSSAVTPTELGYVSGVTSAIQTQFNAKQSTVSIGALDAQAENANGLALASNVLSAQSADGTHPGMVNITTQTFAGAKTFSAATSIIGSADAAQLTVKANGTQTNPLQLWTDSSSVTLASLSAAGNFVVAGTGTGAAPAFQCGTGSTKGGMYSNGGSGVVLAFNGADIIFFKGTEIDLGQTTFFKGGSSSTPSACFGVESTTGFGRSAADVTAWYGSGTKTVELSQSAINLIGVTTIGTGTAGQHVLNTLVKTNGAQAGTITNAPTAGNPTGFIQITVNGTTSYIPYWQ